MGAVREVEHQRRRLQSAFDIASRIGEIEDHDEIEAHYARYLCVLVSGFVERAVAEFASTYADGKAPKPLLRYVELSVRRVTNLDREKLCRFVSAFDEEWGKGLEAFIADERQSALNAVVGLRNQIAHGGTATISLKQVTEYWATVQEVIDELERIFVSAGSVVTRRTSSKRRTS